MPVGVRKLALALHISLSLGWVGAAVAYLAPSVAATTTTSEDTVRAAWIAQEVIGWYAIVPLATGALVSGLVMSLGTRWGLFRHYWVVITLALTTVSTVILLLHMSTVSAMADVARDGQIDMGAYGGDLLHPALGVVVLVFVTALNVYKPRGLTRYGWRVQAQQQATEREPLS
jgi:hypothetical protein